MDTSNPANLLISGIYYVITGILVFFSLIGVYVLIRYGKSFVVSILVSLLYALFFLTILSDSYRALQSL